MNDNQNPYNTPSSPVSKATADIQIPIFKSWLIFFVSAILGALVIAVVIPPIVPIVMAVVHAPFQSQGIFTQITTFICSLPISYIAYRWSINNIILVKDGTPMIHCSISEQVRFTLDQAPVGP